MTNARAGSIRDMERDQQAHGVQVDAVIIPMPGETATRRMPVQVDALHAPALPSGQLNHRRHVREGRQGGTINAIVPQKQEPRPAIVKLGAVYNPIHSW